MNYGLIRSQLLNQAGARLPQILPDLFGKLLEVRLADVQFLCQTFDQRLE
jgi:hypothetical protein